MKILLLLCLVCLICLSRTLAGDYTVDECLNCHQKDAGKSRLVISVEAFETSVHGGEITCMDCHTGVKDKNHEKEKGSGAVDCNQCHDQLNRHGLRSGIQNHTQCYSCHTRHRILSKDNPESSVHMSQLKNTCRECHPLECGQMNFLSWLPSLRVSSHKKQDFSRDYSRAHCLGCHQGQAAHGEEGLLNDQGCNMCHLPGNGEAGLLGYIHVRADIKKQPGVFVAAVAYPFFMVALIWGGLRAYRKGFPKRKRKTGE